MKRPFALLISGAVTAVILLAVLAVASPTSDPVTVEAAAAESADSGNLQAQLNDAYTLLEQRDAAYSQQLQDAYTQIENLQYQDDDSYEDHDESYEDHDDDETEHESED